MDKLKIIKFVVAILSFFLVFGMLCTVGIIYKQVSKASRAAANISLSQPQGSSIADYQISQDRAYILIKNGGLADRIIVLDIKNPQNQTLINLN